MTQNHLQMSYNNHQLTENSQIIDPVVEGLRLMQSGKVSKNNKQVHKFQTLCKELEYKLNKR